MTYLGLLGAALGPPVVGLALRGRRCNVAPEVRTRDQVLAQVGLAVVALAAALPWDAALLARHTWSYPHGLRLGYLLGVPLEECLFMLVQPVLVGLWLRNLPSSLSRTTRPPRGTSTPSWARCAVPAVAVLAAGAGALLAGEDHFSYLGLLMAWAAPAVALQWAVGGDRLWLRRKLLLAAVAVPACYLCLVDRLALSLDLWVLSPERTTGVAVAGLPVEELLFFLLTTLLVAGGLFLATDPVARGRVCAVVTACTGSSIRSENSRSPVGVVDRQTS